MSLVAVIKREGVAAETENKRRFGKFIISFVVYTALRSLIMIRAVIFVYEKSHVRASVRLQRLFTSIMSTKNRSR